jgi:hypothetical protein
VPFLLAALFAVVLRALGLLGSAPGAPVAPDHVPIGGVAIVATVLVLAAGWVFGRGAIVTRLRLGRPVTPDAAAGLGVTSVAVISLVWLRNPYSAGLLVPAAHLWLLTGAPEVRAGRGRALALALGGLLPLALAVLGYCVALRAGPIDVTWLAVLAVGGGHVSPLGVLLGAVVLGCGVSAVALALRRSAPPKSTIAPPDVVSRGPLSYAGPGSLGGTESALRR